MAVCEPMRCSPTTASTLGVNSRFNAARTGRMPHDRHRPDLLGRASRYPESFARGSPDPRRRPAQLLPGRDVFTGWPGLPRRSTSGTPSAARPSPWTATYRSTAKFGGLGLCRTSRTLREAPTGVTGAVSECGPDRSRSSVQPQTLAAALQPCVARSPSEARGVESRRCGRLLVSSGGGAATWARTLPQP